MRNKAAVSAQVSIAALSLLLATCGGGGGVDSTPTPTPAPTPTPTPTPTANHDLIAPLVSESFTNDAAGVSGTFPKDGGLPTLSGQKEAATFRFDAQNNRYQITTGSRTITFKPSDIDQALSNASVTTYVIKSGKTSDSFTLTKSGTSGRFNFQYVGAGYWQHTADGNNAVSGAIDAIVYGVPSPVSAIGSSGRAEYDLDFLGAQTMGGGVEGVSGEGKLQLDLSSGRMTITGWLGTPTVRSWGFTATAKMASGTNGFSGTMNNAPGGQVSGRFFGPEAQEVGGAFSYAGQTQALVGGFLGRGGKLSGAPFDPAKANSEVAGLAAHYDQAAKVLSNVGTKDRPLQVSFDASTETYTLTNAERSYSAKLNTLKEFGTNVDLFVELAPQPYSNFKFLTWKETKSEGPNGTGNQDILRYYIVTGTRTPDGLVPRTGRAGYVVDLRAALARNGAPLGLTGSSDFEEAFGNGTLYLDFAGGNITTSGKLGSSTGFNDEFNGTARLSSGTSAFDGTLSFARGGYSGDWTGHLYGSDASELGSSFRLSNGSDTAIAGLLFGRTDKDLTLDRKGLLDLTEPTTFETLNASSNGGHARLNSGKILITFDPAAHSYVLKADPNTTTILSSLSFGAANIVATDSNADFTHYRLNTGSPEDPVSYVSDIRVLNPGSGNTKIALSYASFATVVMQPGKGFSLTDFAFAWGMTTPAIQLPRTGTAIYNGIVSGGGTISPAGGLGTTYTLSGTNLFNVDFSKEKLTGSFNMLATATMGGGTRNFGDLAFEGTLGRDENGQASLGAAFLDAQGNYLGQLRGFFFGPQGPELAGTFVLDRYNGAETLALAGAFGAKKQ